MVVGLLSTYGEVTNLASSAERSRHRWLCTARLQTSPAVRKGPCTAGYIRRGYKPRQQHRKEQAPLAIYGEVTNLASSAERSRHRWLYTARLQTSPAAPKGPCTAGYVQRGYKPRQQHRKEHHRWLCTARLQTPPAAPKGASPLARFITSPYPNETAKTHSPSHNTKIQYTSHPSFSRPNPRE